MAGFVCGVILAQPLSAEAVARRYMRNLGVLAVGGIALPLAAWALPDAPPDLFGELQRFGKAEQQALEMQQRTGF